MLGDYYRKIKNGGHLFLGFIAFLFTVIIPRDKNIWAFVGWHRSRDGEIYADNTRHFLTYIHKTTPAITPVWIAKDRNLAKQLRSQGIVSYHERSPQGMWYQFRARYFIIDAFLQKHTALFTRNAKIIQLLHGKGLKKKGYAESPLQKNDFIFGTSPFANSLLPTEFTNESRLHVTGYSRNDCLFEQCDSAQQLAQEIELITILKQSRSQQQTIILYAPTFRRGQKTLDPNQHFNLLRAQEFAQLHKCVFLVSLHTKYREQKELYQDGNIIGLPECDINVIMPYIDILITDYSSSYVDYLLLDRPIIFYIHDIEEYHKNEGLIDDYQSHMPGAKVKKQDDLFTTISEIINGNDSWTNERKKVRDLYHTYQDGKSSERILKVLLDSRD